MSFFFNGCAGEGDRRPLFGEELRLLVSDREPRRLGFFCFFTCSGDGDPRPLEELRLLEDWKRRPFRLPVLSCSDDKDRDRPFGSGEALRLGERRTFRSPLFFGCGGGDGEADRERRPFAAGDALPLDDGERRLFRWFFFLGRSGDAERDLLEDDGDRTLLLTRSSFLNFCCAGECDRLAEASLVDFFCTGERLSERLLPMSAFSDTDSE